MFAPDVEKLLNEQIVAEMYSANLYLSMSAWLRDRSLDGYAHWYYVQYKEEMDHALIFCNFMFNAGGQVKLGAIDAPASEFDSLEAILKQTLQHEESVTALIYGIVEAAQKASDFKTVQFLDWFVKEQVEEEDNASSNLGRWQNFGSDSMGLHTLDQEMAARMYTQTAQLALVETGA
ncbi:MAG: ferritin [Coriobacteriia bacterium]|nr:ferritin [Coriobacteriia bacterium]